jgi:hypothetical protein
MTITVDLDSKLELWAVEIKQIRTNAILSAKPIPQQLAVT